ncbi:MAG: maleylacetoacetate isomerase [Bdellovibrionales bacterium]
MKNILYSYYRSSCSYRIRIQLAYKGIEFTYKPIHLVKEGGDQHKSEFSELNPMKQVPYWHDENIGISQSMAIAEYLEEKYPEKPMLPKSINERAKVRELCEIINSGTQPLQNLSALKSLVKDFGFNDQQKNDWVKKVISQGLSAFEQKLDSKDSNYSVNSFSLADAFLLPQVYNAQRFNVDMRVFPKIMEINNFLSEQSFVKKAHPDTQPDTP